MEVPKQLWRLRTLKRTDDDPASYIATSLDIIHEDLNHILFEAFRRLNDGKTLEVSIAHEEITERYRKMYENASKEDMAAPVPKEAVEGGKAYWDKQRDENPYPLGTKAHKDWDYGWGEAESFDEYPEGK